MKQRTNSSTRAVPMLRAGIPLIACAPFASPVPGRDAGPDGQAVKTLGGSACTRRVADHVVHTLPKTAHAVQTSVVGARFSDYCGGESFCN